METNHEIKTSIFTKVKISYEQGLACTIRPTIRIVGNS